MILFLIGQSHGHENEITLQKFVTKQEDLSFLNLKGKN